MKWPWRKGQSVPPPAPVDLPAAHWRWNWQIGEDEDSPMIFETQFLLSPAPQRLLFKFFAHVSNPRGVVYLFEHNDFTSWIRNEQQRAYILHRAQLATVELFSFQVKAAIADFYERERAAKRAAELEASAKTRLEAEWEAWVAQQKADQKQFEEALRLDKERVIAIIRAGGTAELGDWQAAISVCGPSAQGLLKRAEKIIASEKQHRDEMLREAARLVREEERGIAERVKQLEAKFLDCYAEFFVDTSIQNPSISDAQILEQFGRSDPAFDVFAQIAPAGDGWLLRKSGRSDVQQLLRAFSVVPAVPLALTGGSKEPN